LTVARTAPAGRGRLPAERFRGRSRRSRYRRQARAPTGTSGGAGAAAGDAAVHTPPNTRQAQRARLRRPPRHRLRFLRPLRSPRSTRRRTIWQRSWVLPGCHRSRRRQRSPWGLRDPRPPEARRASAAAGAVDGDAGRGPDPPSRRRPAHR